MSGIKRGWTERDVLALPAGEHSYFERKSGRLLDDIDNFRTKVAKALSALANSGGGHLVIGVANDGVFDGVPPKQGRTPTREWLEQLIPKLLSYPLEDFRVHEVEPDTPSAIPAGLVAIVIDVGDSVLVPHQAEGTGIYYYREGGHSKPAPHSYLEKLRNLAGPRLTATLVDFVAGELSDTAAGVFVAGSLSFRIENVGRVAAYHWKLRVEGSTGDAEGREADYRFDRSTYPPEARRGKGGVRIGDETILPGLGRIEKHDFGFLLRAPRADRETLHSDAHAVIPASFHIRYRVATETSRGEHQSSPLASLPGFERFLQSLMV